LVEKMKQSVQTDETSLKVTGILKFDHSKSATISTRRKNLRTSE
jgi:hypothetical protein